MERVTETDRKIGLKIKEIRCLKKVSQREMGVALGISPQQIQKYEYGKDRISASKLLELAILLDVPASYFFPQKTEGLWQDQRLTKIIVAWGKLNEKQRDATATFFSTLVKYNRRS